jgi:hypothetical protein
MAEDLAGTEEDLPTTFDSAVLPTRERQEALINVQVYATKSACIPHNDTKLDDQQHT